MRVFEWHITAFNRVLANRHRLPHALLLRGRQGIGKLAFAQAVAQSLLCTDLQRSGAACGECSACRWFEAGTHPDFRQIEPSSADADVEANAERKGTVQISIEQIRALADFVNISSQRGGLKLILVHPAEALNVNAANALLKSLEEPPAGTHFLLVSHRPHRLLPTIRSRCQQIALPDPKPEEAAAWLRAQGVASPGLSLAQTANAPLLALQLDADYWQLREELLAGLCASPFEPLALAERLRDRPVPHVVGGLQKWSYDLISMKRLGKPRYNPDCEASLAAAAAQVDELSALRFHREMVRLQRIVHHPLNPRLFIEQMLLSYAELLQPSRAAA